jgi:hypothetical protein
MGFLFNMKKQYKFLEKENWFKHDFRSREDKKLIKLKIKWKSSAPIGTFWQLCEMIYENAGLLEYDIDVLAYNCGDSVELVEDVIKMCFIITDDNYLTHETIVEQLDVRQFSYEEISKRNSENAKSRWEKVKESNTTSIPLVYESNTKPYEKIQETRDESKERRVESKELIDKNKLLAAYNAPDLPEIPNTEIDYMIDETEVKFSYEMLDRVINKFIKIDSRFKFQSVMREIDEDYGGFDNLLEMYFPNQNDNSAKINYKNKLKQYKNGIYA